MQDAEGRLKQELLGNGLIARRGYNANTGRLESIATGPDATSATLQNDAYNYDSLGNLLSRVQLVNASGTVMGETLTYDRLNRLQTSQVLGQATKAFAYDSLGNLTTKGATPTATRVQGRAACDPMR